MVGDGEMRPAVESALVALGLDRRVLLAGHVAEPEDLVGAMSIYCSTSDSEQMPIATLEAMACALPVVTTAVGEAIRMLPASCRDCAISMAEPMLVARLADRIRALLHDEPKMRQMGSVNRAKVASDYSIDAVADLHLQVHAGAMAHRVLVSTPAGGLS
jgi:glycosyltransferase involved in cell wall biosynthesis